MLVQVTIPVANVSALITAGYTRIEVWQSKDEGNSYEEVTASSAQAAVLTSTPASTTFRMGGKLLKLKVNGGSEQSISFSTTLDYWTPAQVATRINEVVAGLATVVSGSVVLTSPTTGRTSSLEITYNDAHDLGFVAGQKTFGKAARVTLVGGTLIYTFTDPAGESDDRYKWRFSANGVNPISEFSERVFGSTPPIDPALVSIATATFLSLGGVPIKTSIIIATELAPTLISGYVVGVDQPLVVESDAQGFLQVPLMRGATIRVAIEGTTLIREITVPDVASFDLLTALAAAPDPYTVQTPLPFLIRRSV